jgi:hypothetical protein
MASNKTQSVKKVAPKAKAPTKAKVAPKPKTAAAPVKVGPRHPKGRVTEAHGTKAALAQALAQALARADEDRGALEARLKTASNAQLLRLQRATQTLKQKFGDRDKLIAVIGTANKKSKDKDYLAKLETYSLPQLLDLAASAQRAS